MLYHLKCCDTITVTIIITEISYLSQYLESHFSPQVILIPQLKQYQHYRCKYTCNKPVCIST